MRLSGSDRWGECGSVVEWQSVGRWGEDWGVVGVWVGGWSGRWGEGQSVGWRGWVLEFERGEGNLFIS